MHSKANGAEKTFNDNHIPIILNFGANTIILLMERQYAWTYNPKYNDFMYKVEELFFGYLIRNNNLLCVCVERY